MPAEHHSLPPDCHIHHTKYPLDDNELSVSALQRRQSQCSKRGKGMSLAIMLTRKLL